MTVRTISQRKWLNIQYATLLFPYANIIMISTTVNQHWMSWPHERWCTSWCMYWSALNCDAIAQLTKKWTDYTVSDCKNGLKETTQISKVILLAIQSINIHCNWWSQSFPHGIQIGIHKKRYMTCMYMMLKTKKQGHAHGQTCRSSHQLFWMECWDLND